MWQKLAPMLIILSLALNVAFIGGWAVRRAVKSPDPNERGGDPLRALHRELGVTEDQWSRLEPQIEALRRRAEAGHAEKLRLRSELLDLFAAETPDLQAIAAKQEQIIDGKRRMIQTFGNHLLLEKEILTLAQQKMLFELLRRGGDGHGHMIGRGVPGGPPGPRPTGP